MCLKFSWSALFMLFNVVGWVNFKPIANLTWYSNANNYWPQIKYQPNIAIISWCLYKWVWSSSLLYL